MSDYWWLLVVAELCAIDTIWQYFEAATDREKSSSTSYE